MSVLSAFNSQLLKFFEDLSDTFPEERDIRVAREALEGARKINPRLILDLFYEHVARDLRQAILEEDAEKIVKVGRIKIETQFNEILPAITIFDKHWATLSEQNRASIWKYLKVLIALCDKARTT
jgi:hypothetical protein